MSAADSLSQDADYEVREDERRVFGAAWVYKDAHFPHGVEVEVARIDGPHSSVMVLCAAMPARFYTVSVRPHAATSPAFSLSTGAGAEMSSMTGMIARAAARGMLGLKQ